MGTAIRPKRSRRRRGDPRACAPVTPTQMPSRHGLPPAEVLTPEQIQDVHAYSARLLEEVGIEFMLPAAWDVLEENGAQVDRETGMVKMDRALVEHWVSKAPGTFPLKARESSRDISFGGNEIAYGSVASAPNALDAKRKRTVGNQASFRDLLKLSHMLSTCSFFSGYPVEPIDLPVNTRHLDCYADLLTLSDKPFRIYAIGETRVKDALDMVCLGHGISRDEIKEAPRLITNLNVNSPRRVDAPLLEGAMEMARNGQIVVVTPVAFSGAMTPITLSGTLIQFNAECLATIAFLQMVRPGAPVMYGTVFANVDMKSGAPILGSAEMSTGMIATGQLARHYGIPMRGFLGSSSKAPDAQAAYETMICLWANVLAGVHCVFHAHGLLDTGLIASYEKAVLDSDLIGMMQVVSPTVDFSDIDEAFDAIKTVGPGGHFLGADHTMARYKSAFHTPLLSDWRAYEFWESDGAKDTAVRATEKWKELLESFTPPELPAGRAEALEEFVLRRKQEIGDKDI
ncbi:MAG: trimethylamine methyltransferase family protein [Pseudomonadota bacterium]